jgi:hypothetical protein
MDPLHQAWGGKYWTLYSAQEIMGHNQTPVTLHHWNRS